MFAEWLIIILFLAGCILLFFRQARGWFGGSVVAILTSAALVGAWMWQERLQAAVKSRAELSVPEFRQDEYVSSDTCRSCHPDQHASWHQSFHRTMTQVASPEAVRGPFHNVTLELDGHRYRLDRHGDEFWVEMPDPEPKLRGGAVFNPSAGALVNPDGVAAGPHEPLRVQRRMTMVTGSHHMQAYWVDNEHGNQQFSFPFTYLFEQERWVPRRAVMLMNPRKTNWVQVWNVGCIGCHSTGGQPRIQTNRHDFQTRVGELGIACEACHGPAEKHVKLNSNPRRRYGLHLQAKTDDQIVNPKRLSPKRSSEVCGKCHSITTPQNEKEWLRDGDGFRAGDDLEKKLRVLIEPQSAQLRDGLFWRDGMIRVSGREYNGLLKTPCFERGEMSCLSCHSMHQSSPTNQLARGMESNDACLQCHTKFTTRLEEHTHHPASSSGSLCYNCHMPYTTYGLLKALRSHEINSPTMKATLQTGRPNACNLCHLDKSLDWAGQKLAEWYRQPVEELLPKEKTAAASVLWALQGDAGQRALVAWHMGWEPARKASGEFWLPPYLAVLMQDDYPAVRYLAERSLRRLSGFERIAYDYLDTQAMNRSTEAVFATWMKSVKARENPELLLDRRGHFDDVAARRLLEGRNNRIVELNE